MSTLRTLENQINLLVTQLIQELESVEESIGHTKKRLKSGDPVGLAGALQNTWSVYHNLGRLDSLVRIYELIVDEVD